MRKMDFRYLHYHSEIFEHTLATMHPQDLFEKYKRKTKKQYQEIKLDKNSQVTQMRRKLGKNQFNKIEKLMTDINRGKALLDNNSISAEVNDRIFKAIGVTRQLSGHLFKLDSEIKSGVKDLGDLVKSVNEFSKIINECDEDVARFLKSDTRFSDMKVGDRVSMLNVNKTGMTSYDNLVKLMDRISNNERSNINIYTEIRQRVINILGALGESMAYVNATEVADQVTVELKDVKGLTIVATPTGTSKDQMHSRYTSVSDISLKVFNKDTAELNIGISVKAQYAKKGKKFQTTFRSPKLSSVIELAGGKLNHVDLYIFLNSILHNVDSKFKMSYRGKNIGMMRRYFASTVIDKSLSGMGGSDSVFFLQYLDHVYPVHEYFNELAELADKDYNKLPTMNVIGATNLNKQYVRGQLGEDIPKYDKDLTDKSVLAYERSKMVQQALLNLNTQIVRNFSS